MWFNPQAQQGSPNEQKRVGPEGPNGKKWSRPCDCVTPHFPPGNPGSTRGFVPVAHPGLSVFVLQCRLLILASQYQRPQGSLSPCMMSASLDAFSRPVAGPVDAVTPKRLTVDELDVPQPHPPAPQPGVFPTLASRMPWKELSKLKASTARFGKTGRGAERQRRGAE